MPIKDDITNPEELELVQRVHEKVLSYLKTRYLAIGVLLAVLGPIFGILLGLAAQSSLMQTATTRAVDRAESKADEIIGDAKVILADLQQLRDEVQRTKGALDAVLSSPTPLAAMTATQAELENLRLEYSNIDKEIAGIRETVAAVAPGGLEALKVDLENLESIKRSIDQIDAYFQNEKNAKALASAFFKIYEFQVDKFNFQYYSTLDEPELQYLQSMVDNMLVSVEFRQSGSTAAESILRWERLPIKFSYEKLRQPVRASTISHSYVVSIQFSCPNNSAWWNIASDGTSSSLKSTDLQAISRFDTIQIDFELTGDNSARILEVLSKGHVKIGDGVGNATAIIRSMQGDLLVNREKIKLAQRHLPIQEDEISNPLLGGVQKGTTFRFIIDIAKPFFEAAQDEYVTELVSRAG